MKQTKAAFRNKPFISLKGSILFLILIPMSGLIHAQYSMGTTGQLMIPTAEMQETGTFTGGVNFLPEQVTPSVFSFPDRKSTRLNSSHPNPSRMPSSA